MLFFRTIINIFLVPSITICIITEKSQYKKSIQVIFKWIVLVVVNMPVAMAIAGLATNVGREIPLESSYFTCCSIISSLIIAVVIKYFCFILGLKKGLVICGISVLIVIVAMATATIGIFRLAGRPNNELQSENDSNTMNLAGLGENGQLTLNANEKSQNKLYVIFTIDTEDNRGHEPYLIEGDLQEFGIKENCGVDYIIDTFDNHDSRAVFFVNIYEHNLYDDDYMPELLRRISNSGNEVALHAHIPSDNSLPFFSKNLLDYSVDEQEAIFQYGKEYIENAIGKTPVSYRSGAYRANDDTLKALAKAGFAVDSSLYWNHKNSEITNGAFHNQIFIQDGIIEIPIVDIFNGYGWRKLDLDSMPYEDITRTLEICYDDDSYNCVQLMFHSFSCMDLRDEEGKEPLYQDGNKNIYGEDTNDKEKLNAILDYINSSDRYEIITFEEYLAKGLEIPEYSDDNIIYLDNKELAFRIPDVEIKSDENVLYLDNKFESGVSLEYRYVLTDDQNETIYDSEWSSSSMYSVELMNSISGTLSVKCYVKNEDNKVGYECYKINVSNGLIEKIERV